MPIIKINTFGIGIEIRQLQLSVETHQNWNAIAERKKQLLPDLLLDPFFYYDLKDKRFSQLTDIEATVVLGMVNNPQSHIEIWFNRKKVLKIRSHELFDEMVLFPLFQIENSQSFDSKELDNGIYIIQKTIGLLNSQQLEVSVSQLNMDDFCFTIADFKSEQFLTKIKYQDQNLNSVKSETIISYQTAFEIK